MKATRCTVAALILLATAATQAQIPDKTRAEILNYAATGIGSPYVWGGGNWDPLDRATVAPTVGLRQQGVVADKVDDLPRRLSRLLDF
jgi:cell wall-associated NlpC family hydrolase